MKNKEKFIDEILKVALDEGVLAIKNGIPVSCIEVGCKECYFGKKSNNCKNLIIEWAESEYIESKEKVIPAIPKTKIDKSQIETKLSRKEILEKALKCVMGDREQDYGTPENNFNLIAELWSVYTGKTFNAVDVAVMLALLKIARIRSGHGKADNWVDLAGYAACGGEMEGEIVNE